MNHEDLIRIYKGNHKNAPEPNSNLIRIFLSSTFSGNYSILCLTQ